MSEIVEKLKQIGGSEWVAGDRHRIYFNDLPSWYGLRVERYGTGNISSAKLDGQKISNSRARKIESALYGKLWYDVGTGKFESKGIPEDAAARIVGKIRQRLEGAD